MFLLWLFCVINSGCINPEAPRNVYQYTDSVSDSLETFKPEMFLVRLKYIQNHTKGYLFTCPEQLKEGLRKMENLNGICPPPLNVINFH